MNGFCIRSAPQIAEVINGTEKIRNFVRELDIAGARFNLADGSVDAHR